MGTFFPHVGMGLLGGGVPLQCPKCFAIFATLWAMLRHFGRFCGTFDDFATLWAILRYFGRFCDTLCDFAALWAILRQIRRFLRKFRKTKAELKMTSLSASDKWLSQSPPSAAAAGTPSEERLPPPSTAATTPTGELSSQSSASRGQQCSGRSTCFSAEEI
jgi:hypothetical protein